MLLIVNYIAYFSCCHSYHFCCNTVVLSRCQHRYHEKKKGSLLAPCRNGYLNIIILTTDMDNWQPSIVYSDCVYSYKQFVGCEIVYACHAGHLHEGKRKATVWCLSVRLSVCLSVPHFVISKNSTRLQSYYACWWVRGGALFLAMTTHGSHCHWRRRSVAASVRFVFLNQSRPGAVLRGGSRPPS